MLYKVQNTDNYINQKEIFTGSPYKSLLRLTVISDAYISFNRNKTTFTKYRLTFKDPWKLWNLLTNPAPGKFDRSDRQSLPQEDIVWLPKYPHDNLQNNDTQLKV